MALGRNTTLPGWAALLTDVTVKRLLQASASRLINLLPASVPRAEALSRPIPSLMRGNPDHAAAFYRGQFTLAGQTVNVGNRSVFEVAKPSEQFAACLHGFDWLRHFEAAGRELPRVQARALIIDWIQIGRNHDHTARRLDVAARRLISWIRHGSFMLHNAPCVFRDKFLSSLARQTAALTHAMMFAPPARARLDAALAVLYATIALDGLERQRAQALRRVSRELELQILADGGHISRNPANVVEILLDLVPLGAALDEAGIPVPDGMHYAIERMLPMLRFLLHGDGGIAVFNGVSDPLTGAARAIVDADRVRGRPITLASHFGYARLAHARATVLVDVGRPPAPGQNSGAQLGPLSFEFSDGAHRVVVNCGLPQQDEAEWTAAARRTAAHSTVTINECSAGRIVTGRVVDRLLGGALLIGPRRVESTLVPHEAGSILEARHDGYMSRFGFWHERRLFLSRDGTDLRGEDRFVPGEDERSTDPDAPFAVRFHLHPSVKATVSRDGGSVVLVLPNRTGWRFCARGAQPALEASVYLAGRALPRRTQQIVLSGLVGSSPVIKWAFKRIERASPQTAQVSARPELPL